jgi:DNA topoisomerase IB
MARTRRVDCSRPGITRKRSGRGFAYFDCAGSPVTDPGDLARIAALAIPPAWRDVWICPLERGHLQATGIDEAGRKQYLYHADWRSRRDQEKFDEMLDFARALPALRRRVEADLTGSDALSRERVLACAVRLLERGFFRIGSEDYAVRNETYGLATMGKRHVRLCADGLMVFDYPAKHGKRRVQGVVDPVASEIVAQLKRRRGGGPELLACKEGGRWQDIRSPDINAYVKLAAGGDFSAKDFRTWSATVLCAVALAVAGEVASSRTRRQRAKSRAVAEVAHYLGNTPAVCRASYIDPRAMDAYDAGVTILPALERATSVGAAGEMLIHHPLIEQAVIALVEAPRKASPALARVA